MSDDTPSPLNASSRYDCCSVGAFSFANSRRASAASYSGGDNRQIGFRAIQIVGKFGVVADRLDEVAAVRRTHERITDSAQRLRDPLIGGRHISTARDRYHG